TQSIYYAANVAAAAAGANTVTATVTAPAAYPDVRIAEYSGGASASPVGGTEAAQGNGAVSDSGAVTTSNAHDLQVGGNVVPTATSTSQVALTWTASTDDVGVTGYLVERCQGSGCTTFGQVAAPADTATSYSDTGLLASTSYSYRVRATDAAGNLSAYSNVAG